MTNLFDLLKTVNLVPLHVKGKCGFDVVIPGPSDGFRKSVDTHPITHVGVVAEIYTRPHGATEDDIMEPDWEFASINDDGIVLALDCLGAINLDKFSMRDYVALKAKIQSFKDYYTNGMGEEMLRQCHAIPVVVTGQTITLKDYLRPRNELKLARSIGFKE